MSCNTSDQADFGKTSSRKRLSYTGIYSTIPGLVRAARGADGKKFDGLIHLAAGYDVKGRISGLEQNPANLLPVVMEVAAGLRKEMQVFGNDYDTPDGTCIRDYIHVSDLASGHVAAMDYLAGKDKSLIVNLGSETGLSVLEVIEAARRSTGKPIPTKIVARRPGDPAKLTASAQYARETLGWTARYSDIDTLVSTTWKAYQRH
jgi:UDP-glucose 4-epimerase